MKIIDQNTVKLCKAGSCCPIVERISSDEYTIADDYEGKVKFTRDEMQMLKEAINHFENN